MKSALVTNQIDAGVQACVQGVGYGRFLDYHVLNEIKTGKLARILEKYEGDPVPANILHPSSRHQSPNVRSFVAFAQARLKVQLRKLQRH